MIRQDYAGTRCTNCHATASQLVALANMLDPDIPENQKMSYLEQLHNFGRNKDEIREYFMETFANSEQCLEQYMRYFYVGAEREIEIFSVEVDEAGCHYSPLSFNQPSKKKN